MNTPVFLFIAPSVVSTKHPSYLMTVGRMWRWVMWQSNTTRDDEEE